MSKTTVKTKHIHMFGKKVNLPDIGNVELSENGEVEIPSEIAALLPEEDWEVKKDAEETNTDSQQDESGETEEEALVDSELMKHLIKNLGEEEIKSILKPIVSKTVIAKAKTKADLVKMVIKNLPLDDKKQILASEQK